MFRWSDMRANCYQYLLVIAGLLAGDGPVVAQTYSEDPFAGGELAGRGLDQADQWGLERIGLGIELRRELAGDLKRTSIVVAVIDTGLDIDHQDFSRNNLWMNEREEPNGLDDDDNGYVDDFYGWDFIDKDNDPTDWVGHGTVVAGIIAANTGNGLGIAGVDSRARIMPLRALNMIGRGYSTRIAQAIYYAVDNGAQIINLSMAIEDVSAHERVAIRYAQSHGVLTVVAAGNNAKDAANFTPASIPGVITVSATNREDQFAGFSNWGTAIDIAAPGVDILSLRAAGTDLMMTATPDARPLQYAVGPRTRYYRTTGTSFAAPIVSGVAAVVWSLHPLLSADEVRRMLLNSAEDVDSPGMDQYTGYGLLNAQSALKADPAFYVTAGIDQVQVVMEGQAPVVRVYGTVEADQYDGAELYIGAGQEPEGWQSIGRINKPIQHGVLGDIPALKLQGAAIWTIRVITRHQSGREREGRFLLNVG